MLLALTRAVSPAIQRCELTHLQRSATDFELAQAQHRAYEQALSDLGCTVQRLLVEPDLPDAVFVEDAAIVLDELAIITRPGATSRRPETQSVAAALRRYRPLHRIEAPGTIDGGDVLRLGQTLFVGVSSRSNEAGVAQMRAILAPHGYDVQALFVHGCLHLKSAVTQVAADVLLLNPGWIEGTGFGDWKVIEVDRAEAQAANALLLGEAVILPAQFPRTRQRLEDAGINVVSVDVSELTKAEGGVTCCSLIFNA